LALQKNLPGEIQYSKYEKDNPFDLYCSYLDLVRPIDLKEKTRAQKEEFHEI
jgi:hypothetical protein